MSDLKAIKDINHSNDTLYSQTAAQHANQQGNSDVEKDNGTDPEELTNDSPPSQNTVTKTEIADRPHTVFTQRQKAILVLTATLGACFSPFTANIYLPAIDTISRALNVSVTKVNLTITTYMIFQAISPTFISAIADSHGRRPGYVIGFGVYMIANLGLGLNNSYAGLLVLRCLQSAGSSGLVTLAYGTIADVITSAERGKYIAITSLASILAPSIAPILGGALAQNLGWHSIFWALLIGSVIYFIPLALFFPETGRQLVGDGSIQPTKWNRCLTDILRARKLGPQDVESNKEKIELPPRKKPNFLGTLSIVRDPTTAILLLNMSINYAAFYTISTSLTVQFGKIYHLDSTIQGLLYLPQSLGTIGAAIWNTKMTDRWYKRHATRAGIPTDRSRQINILTTKMPIERARIELALPMMVMMSILMMVYGWLLEARVHIAGPIVILCFLGFFAMTAFSPLNALVIDLHRSRSATASASSNLMRCLFGAGSTAVVNPMINAMGNGWTFTVVGLISLAALPLLGFVAIKGQALRAKRLEKETKKAEKQKEKEAAKLRSTG